MSEETKEIVEKEIIQESDINIDENAIKSLIYVVRGQQVMLDSDLAMLYCVETKNLNKAMKRNINRFPEEFCFQLKKEEYENLKFQFGTSSLECMSGEHGGRRKLPYVYTEQREKVTVRIYTVKKTKLSATDVSNFNKQYPALEVHYTSEFHDRFLIVDESLAYHIGASLKDAGKKCFAINRIEDRENITDILNRLTE